MSEEEENQNKEEDTNAENESVPKVSGKKFDGIQFTSVKLCSKFGAIIFKDKSSSFIQTSTQNVRQ